MIYIEWLVIMLIAFLVIGPKDFPKIMFTLGDFIRRMKHLGGTFYDHMQDLSEQDPPQETHPHNEDAQQGLKGARSAHTQSAPRKSIPPLPFFKKTSGILGHKPMALGKRFDKHFDKTNPKNKQRTGSMGQNAGTLSQDTLLIHSQAKGRRKTTKTSTNTHAS
jgi:Sec-independent protein translocase protein TatA